MSHLHLFNCKGFVLFCQIFNLHLLNKIFANSKEIMSFTFLKIMHSLTTIIIKFWENVGETKCKNKAVPVPWLSLNFLSKPWILHIFFQRPGNKFRVFRRSNQTILLFLTLFRPKIGFPGCLCSCSLLRKRKKRGNDGFQ